MKSRAFPLAQRAMEIQDRAAEQERSLTDAEREKVEDLIARAQEAKNLDVRIRELEGEAID